MQKMKPYNNQLLAPATPNNQLMAHATPMPVHNQAGLRPEHNNNVDKLDKKDVMRNVLSNQLASMQTEPNAMGGLAGIIGGLALGDNMGDGALGDMIGNGINDLGEIVGINESTQFLQDATNPMRKIVNKIY